MPYRLIVVDDEDVSREGLARLVDWGDMGFEVVGAFEDGSDALAFMENEPVDVVLTDIRMSDVSGLELARQVRGRHPHVQVVLISGYRDFEYARQAIRYQVVNYLLKPIQLGQVVNVFQEVRQRLDKQRLAKAREDPAGDEVIDRVRAFVHDRLDQHLSLKAAAEVVYRSPGYLSRYYHEKTGETFVRYVMRMRVEKAAELLIHGDGRVYEICCEVGYNDLVLPVRRPDPSHGKVDFHYSVFCLLQHWITTFSLPEKLLVTHGKIPPKILDTNPNLIYS